MSVESPEGGATRIFGNEAFRRGWTTAEQGADLNRPPTR